jgi:hypothetical protein
VLLLVATLARAQQPNDAATSAQSSGQELATLEKPYAVAVEQRGEIDDYSFQIGGLMACPSLGDLTNFTALINSATKQDAASQIAAMKGEDPQQVTAEQVSAQQAEENARLAAFRAGCEVIPYNDTGKVIASTGYPNGDYRMRMDDGGGTFWMGSAGVIPASPPEANHGAAGQ